MPNKTLEKWEEKTIKDVAQICLGLTHTPKYVENGIPFLSVKDISSGHIDFSNTKYISSEEFETFPNGAKPQNGDVLFARVGTLGCPSIVETDIKFGTFVSLGYFRPYKSIVMNTYLRYWMLSPIFWQQVNQNVQGSTLKNLNTSWLKDFKIPIPSLSEQQRIVGILDETFENIEKAKQNALQNLNNARELFESYLYSFFIKDNEYWEENNLQSICENISAGGDKPQTFSQIKTNECYIPIYSNGTKDNGLYGYTDKATINKPAITISARGTIGFICKRTEPYFPIVRLISLIPKDFIDLSFLAYAMNFVVPKNTGTSIPQLTVPNIKNSVIKYPSIHEQQKIVAQLDELQEQTKKLEQIYAQKIKDLDELKQSILQKAFNGEL